MEDIFTNPAFVKAVLLFGWVLAYGVWLSFRKGEKRSTTPDSKREG